MKRPRIFLDGGLEATEDEYKVYWFPKWKKIFIDTTITKIDFTGCGEIYISSYIHKPIDMITDTRHKIVAIPNYFTGLIDFKHTKDI